MHVKVFPKSYLHESICAHMLKVLILELVVCLENYLHNLYHHHCPTSHQIAQMNISYFKSRPNIEYFF